MRYQAGDEISFAYVDGTGARVATSFASEGSGEAQASGASDAGDAAGSASSGAAS